MEKDKPIFTRKSLKRDLEIKKLKEASNKVNKDCCPAPPILERGLQNKKGREL